MRYAVPVVILGFSLPLSSTSFNAQAPTSSGIELVLSQRTYMDQASALAVDAAGNIWAAGSGHDTAMPTTPDAVMRTARGHSDGFLARFRPDGSLVYLSYIGGNDTDQITGLAIDAGGSIYLTGLTHSSDFPATSGAFDTLCGIDGTCKANPGDPAGTPDGFVLKLTPGARSIAYSTYLGGRNLDQSRGIAVDANGRAHVVGVTYSTDFPNTTGIVPARTGWQDGFYVQLSADGSSLEFASPIGGSTADDAYGVALDFAGNSYVTGYTSSADFPVSNALKATYPSTSGAQGFLAKFTPAGALTYATYIGGSNTDYAYDVAVSSTGVYLTGAACSWDFPGAPRAGSDPGGCNWAAFVMKVRLDGAAILGTVALNSSGYGDRGEAVAVDGNDVVFLAGSSDFRDFPVTRDAAQIASGGGMDAFFAVVPMAEASVARASYATYLGGAMQDSARAVVADGAGGAWAGGFTHSADFPRVNAKQDPSSPAYLAHFAVTGAQPPPSHDIVLYAGDATTVAGNWQRTADTTAAGGYRMWNPDAEVPKIATASASPSTYFELQFEAQAGVPYHLWLRMKADGNSWMNDSVFVQFSDSVSATGQPVWRIGSTDATMVSLEDCVGCGEDGWGWNDNGYNVYGVTVEFLETGTHAIRIQQREDGISIDQIVLSSRTYINSAPGAARNDGTMLPPSGGGTPPPPPPPSDPREIVLYVASEHVAGGQNWMVATDATAAGGARLLNPDQGLAKTTSPLASGNDYFEVAFTAEAGVPYHLWVRAKAQNDYYGNDSALVQFSHSVDATNSPIFRIGSDSATNVILEDCSGCGLQGWGWTDNSYGAFAAPIYFAISGPQRIRVLRREDGISIDQIVLSAGKYLKASPGLAKNDSTIVPK
jgi:hypothetical protein